MGRYRGGLDHPDGSEEDSPDDDGEGEGEDVGAGSDDCVGVEDSRTPILVSLRASSLSGSIPS